MKNYNIDFAKNTITVSEAFMKEAGQLGTTEFTTMMELRKLNMTIVVKEAKPRKKPEFSGGTIEGAIPFDVLHMDAFALHIIRDDGFRCGVRVCAVGKLGGKSCLYAFALVHMEDVVITQEGDLLDFACLFVFLVNPLPEDHHMGLLALADKAAFFLDLLIGEVFASASKQHLVKKAVRLASGVGDGSACRHPRLLPRDYALFHLCNHAVRDFAVNVKHFSCSLLLCGSIDLW